MRNFLKVADGIDVLPLMNDIARQSDLWNASTVRTFHEQSAHRSLDDIVLRYNRFEAGDDFLETVCSQIAVENYPAFERLPLARQLVMALMGRLGGEHLGRVFISRIAPGGGIPPHTDRIEPAEAAFPGREVPALYYDRYHIVLQSAPGTVFVCGDEQTYMPAGSAWWFDNTLEHSVFNGSAEDRVHLICDIHLPSRGYVPSGAPRRCH